MAGKIDAFQLARHFLSNFNWGNSVENIQNLFDSQLTGNNVREQFLIDIQRLGCSEFLIEGSLQYPFNGRSDNRARLPNTLKIKIVPISFFRDGKHNISEHLAVENKRDLSPAALLVTGAFFIEFIDDMVIITALPDMVKSFSVHTVGLNIGISTYLITLAVLIPAGGRVADCFGARKVFTLALVIFTLASVLCGLPESLESFVAMRILQGVGDMPMAPVGRLAILRTTPKHQLITAIATLIWPALVVPIIDFPFSGFATSYASRHWIFFVSVPFEILVTALALHFIPDTHDDERRPFNITGFIATAVAMVSLVYAMELLGTQQPQGQLVAGLLALGTVTFLFALHHFHRTA